MTTDHVAFVQAIAATAAFINGVFFFRFWRESGDRLFWLFAAAFWLLGSSWALLGWFSPTEETRPYVYAIRLLAFVLIVVAIVQKNRESA
jgi:hypothetical protein